MKQLITLAIFFGMAINAFTQQIKQSKPARVPLSQKEYKSRSNDQLVGGIVLVTAGAGLIVLGASVQRKSSGFDVTGYGLEALGIIAIGGSIPLFIASANSHKKAKQFAVNIKTDNAIAVRQFSFAHQIFPAVSVKINL